MTSDQKKLDFKLLALQLKVNTTNDPQNLIM